MFLRSLMNKSTETYLDKLHRLKSALNDADAIIIGAGSGLSTAAGFTYSANVFNGIFTILQTNIISRIFTRVDFILFKILKNIGHGGVVIFG